jgi:outer membrane protein assembly factor BamB
MISRRTALALSVLTLAGLTTVAAVAQTPRAGNWPQWQGPNRDGLSTEKGLLKSWPAEGPRVIWRATGLGGGNSTPSVAGGRIYGMSYAGQDETIWAVSEQDGKPLWKVRIAPANFNIGRQAHDGSGGSPTISGNRLYALGVSGDLVCLDAASGKLVWQKNLVTDFGGRVPQWGYSESPLVDGNAVVAAPGGGAATIVALNKMTGDVIWKSAIPEADGASYASAIVADVAGEREYIHFLSKGVVGVSAKDGAFRWRYNSPANGTANCSTPIFRNNTVFAASGYNNGGGLAKLEKGPNGVTANEVYFTKRMQNHHGGMVLVGDYLYGFDGANLTCIDFKTGEVKWFDRSVGKGSVAYADGLIYARSENGPVAIVEATPTAYVEKGRFNPPDKLGKTTWPHPVITGGRLYLRDMDQLFAYDIKDPAAP